MKTHILLPLLLISAYSMSQVPEDALRYSFYPQMGTARSMAIGGAMGSLGGDITATFVNPAGLGLYKTSEFVFTPGFNFNTNKSNFRGTGLNSNKNDFAIGTIGYVFGLPQASNSTKTHAFSLAYTKNADFNNSVSFKGYNNYSSGSEQWAEEIASSGLSITDILNSPQYYYGSALALNTYLVDTFSSNGNTYVRGLPEFLLDNNQALLQQKTIVTKGGLNEFALGYATNYNDKWMLGFTLGIPILNYQSNSTFTESDTSSNTNNNFGYFSYTDQYKTSGVGVNLKMGFIYKISPTFRLGAAFHTPTKFFTLTDTRSSFMTTETEGYAGLLTASSDALNNGLQGVSTYSMTTPLKFLISGSYVFKQSEDVSQQRGFVTADIEYVNHRGTRFQSANIVPTSEEIAYYKYLGSVIKQNYKGNINYRVGGELKFNTIMGRLGFAYYSDPYQDNQLKANRILLSGGIGYRNHGIFADLTYVQSFNKDVNFPYRLQDKSNTYATIKNSQGNIVATVGFKF